MAPDSTPYRYLTGQDVRTIRHHLHMPLKDFAAAIHDYDPHFCYHRATISYWEHHYKERPLPPLISDTIFAYAESHDVAAVKFQQRKINLFAAFDKGLTTA